jgi:hypothetical protein
LRILLSLLLVLALAVGCADPLILIPDPVRVRVASIDIARLRPFLEKLTRSEDQRSWLLAYAFREAGCQGRQLERLPGARGESVICTLPGRTDWTIVVAANVDPPLEGPGVVDNGTGMALLPQLYQALATEPRQHTFVFAGFADAMLRQRGARSWLREMGRAGRSRIRAMVQLKALGVGSTAMWGSLADPALRQDLLSVSRALDLPLRDVAFQAKVVLDARAFASAGIPVITVHSLDRASARLLEQPYMDQGTSSLDWELYGDTARMLAFYLAYLDMTLQLRIDSQPELVEDQAPPKPL